MKYSAGSISKASALQSGADLTLILCQTPLAQTLAEAHPKLPEAVWSPEEQK